MTSIDGVVISEKSKDILSNFFEDEIEMDGVRWNSAESYIQSQKYDYDGGREYYKLILETDRSLKSKLLGNKTINYEFKNWVVNKKSNQTNIIEAIKKYEELKIRDDWEMVKERIYTKILEKKFDKNKNKLKLLSLYPFDNIVCYDPILLKILEELFKKINKDEGIRVNKKKIFKESDGKFYFLEEILEIFDDMDIGMLNDINNLYITDFEDYGKALEMRMKILEKKFSFDEIKIENKNNEFIEKTKEVLDLYEIYEAILDDNDPDIKYQIIFGDREEKYDFLTKKTEEYEIYMTHEHILIEMKNISNEGTIINDIYTCSKCHNKSVLYVAKQTKRADEAETIFLTCTKCKNKWKIQ